MRSSIFTTDIHLTDQPQDKYRFKLFPMLRDTITSLGLSYCFILGDLTDKTDRHPSTLVNPIVDGLHSLAEVAQVFILRGNHDCVDPNLPYLQFLRHIPNVHYFKSPERFVLDGTKVLMLPHSRDPAQEWGDGLGMANADVVFLHQTLEGSVSENGTAMKGLPPEFFANCKEVYSGDVHVPQRMGNLLYVGSPYHVHFGDHFKPVFRIRHQDGHIQDIPTGMPSRHMLNLTSIEEFGTRELAPGDQVKIRLNVSAQDWTRWPELQQQLRAMCEEAGVECCGIEPIVLETKTKKADTPSAILEQQESKTVVERFLKQKYPNLTAAYLQVGNDIIKSVDGV